MRPNKISVALLRPRRLGVLVVAALAFVVLVPASPAGAHAVLSDSFPADGAVLTVAPASLRLQFSESVVIEATRIDIADGAGRHFLPAHLRLVHPGNNNSTEEPTQVVADLPELPQAAYRITWETLSSDDLHRTSGLFVFGVNQRVTASAFHESTPRPEEVALRWLLFLFLAGALGGQLAVRLYRRHDGDRDGALVARCRRISVGGGAAGALAATALLIDQLLSSKSSLGALFASSYGERWAVREVGLLILLLGAFLGMRSVRARGVGGVLVIAGAVCACLGSALLGHAGAGSGVAPTRTLADASHLAAAATWSGMLLVAVFVVLPQLRAGGDTAVRGRAVLRAFGIPAALCVSVMIVTGIYLASGLVGSLDAALLTTYGRTLLIKIGVVGIIGVLGLVSSTRLHRAGSLRSPRATIAAEALLSVVVLGLAAVLTSGQPARESQFVAPSAVALVPVLDTGVADLQESLAIKPNQPGRNVVLVDVFDTRRPAPAPIRRVLVSFVGLDGHTTSAVAAVRLADGHWSAGTSIDAPGRTQVQVSVQRAGFPDATHVYRWTVGGGPVHTRRAMLSTAPIADTLEELSGVLAGLLAIGWATAAWWRVATHRRRQRRNQDLPDQPVTSKDLVNTG